MLLDCRARRSTSSTPRSRCSPKPRSGFGATGRELWLAALNPEVLAVVQHSPLGQPLGRERMFFNVQTAVHHYEQVAVAAQARVAGDALDPAQGLAKPAAR